MFAMFVNNASRPVLLPYLDHLIRNLGKSNIMADEEELIVPVLGHLFPANINRAEGMGQVLPAGSVQV